MKQFFSLMAAAMISFGAFAQLPDGSIAPDFTATDINGVEHNLYSYLDSGYQVILDFSATWCGPCWSYHTSGVFSDLNATYGPAGSNEIRIIKLESDDTTTEADLNGTGANTQGDWVTGTTYNIIDNASNIFDDYQNTYYPTIYTVCPNRILTQSGQASAADHAAIFQADDCAYTTLATDGALLNYTGSDLICGDEQASLSVQLMNNGLDNLTSCTITAFDNGTEVASTDWSGDLATYEVENVVVGSAAFSAVPNLTFEITNADEDATNNSAAGAVALSPETTTYVQVRVTTDNWPEETGWEIVDDMGTVVESVAVGSLTNADTDYTGTWACPAWVATASRCLTRTATDCTPHSGGTSSTAPQVCTAWTVKRRSTSCSNTTVPQASNSASSPWAWRPPLWPASTKPTWRRR